MLLRKEESTLEEGDEVRWEGEVEMVVRLFRPSGQSRVIRGSGADANKTTLCEQQSNPGHAQWQWLVLVL